MGVRVAAGHGTFEEATASVMLAACGGFAICGLRIMSGRISVTMGGAHSAITTVGSLGLPGSGPKRRPKQYGSDETDTRGTLSSRSERKLERRWHALEVGFYNRSATAARKCLSNFCHLQLSNRA